MFWNKKEIDPVCKMKVEKNTAFKSIYNDKEYYFCAANCKQKFDKEPQKYAK